MRVPKDAEFIALGRGENAVYNSDNITYQRTAGGGLTHACVVSRTGARKLIKALVPIWTVFDILVHKASCFYDDVHEKYDDLHATKRDDDLASQMGRKNQMLRPCVQMYEGIKIFDQTSNPTPPIRTDTMPMSIVHERIMAQDAGYMIHPKDWVNEASVV